MRILVAISIFLFTTILKATEPKVVVQLTKGGPFGYKDVRESHSECYSDISCEGKGFSACRFELLAPGCMDIHDVNSIIAQVEKAIKKRKRSGSLEVSDIKAEWKYDRKTKIATITITLKTSSLQN
ncbi:MAG: hypothetical protein ACK4EX_01020 [Thermaurantimonas sp.]|uniref:hypothetical protein n=1 Tax=Thermaurantimonas sp. TaxID=2681568 RepID=UPI00391D74ED